MSLTTADREEIEVRLQLGVEKYFNHFLIEVLPEILDRALSTHDHNCRAHDGVNKRVERYRWLIVGAIVGGSIGGGVGLVKLLSLFIR